MYHSGSKKTLHHLAAGTGQLATVHHLLTDEEINMVCRQLGHTWRDRLLSPATTVRSMLYRSLHSDKSIPNVLTELAAEDGGQRPVPSDSAWCQARSRLPEGLWPELIHSRAQQTIAAAGSLRTYQGRPVYIVDGSTLSMPDEPALVKAFGYAKTKHGPSRFPVARLTLIVHAGSQAACDYRLGPYTCSETEMFYQMWQQIPDGAICLCDRYFSSFYILAKLVGRGVDILCPLHQLRDPERLIAEGRPLGPNEWLVTLELPRGAREKYQDPSLPDRLTLRLIRVRPGKGRNRQTRWLITTLLDHRLYRRSDLVRWYHNRWPIETDLRYLKTTLQINVLRSKTPAGVRGEVAATILAYDLVWTIIPQAARQEHVKAPRISFTCAVRTLVEFSNALRLAEPDQRPEIYHNVLREIARHTNRHRPGRTEPRMIKRDPVRYPYMRIPREQARALCLS